MTRVPGGLVVSNLGACALFSAMSGSSPATCAAIGKMGIPEMRKRGYPDGVAAGSIAAGGTLGILIPPSVTMIVYGWVTDTSIQQTGGYFYSRALLMLINGSLSFLVMLLVGLDAVYALPLAVFMGFVSEFIPAIGTYIGGAIPIAFVLVAEGVTPALILLEVTASSPRSVFLIVPSRILFEVTAS